MIEPQKLRERLFRRGKPAFRQATTDDMRWLWASYKLNDGSADQESFSAEITEQISQYQRAYMAEDENSHFETGRGPVGIITVHYDGWSVKPEMSFFPWATARNKLKSIVGFLMNQRFESDVGSIEIRTGEDGRDFCKRLRNYLPIRVGGKIAGGRPAGADYIYYVRGKKHGNL